MSDRKLTTSQEPDAVATFLAEVRLLHYPTLRSRKYCAACAVPWPCQTSLLADGVEAAIEHILSGDDNAADGIARITEALTGGDQPDGS